MEVSFKRSEEERRMTRRAVRRARRLGLIFEGYDRVHCEMDLTATNANGTPLAFDRLLSFDDFDFTHDITGIARHLDRTTGKLGDNFRPRASERAA
ncbi:DUF6874 family protein [Kaistia sp. MMO-174]|uniref:DUF6874 family protein n=1 Tax=Kaistia sp. MMO-174 TaxID=3081256 RepID=UPI003016A96D